MGWTEYIRRYPPGWREDRRAFYVMQAVHMGKNKLKPGDFYPALDVIEKNARRSQAEQERRLQQHPIIATLRARDKNFLGWLDKTPEQREITEYGGG